MYSSPSPADVPPPPPPPPPRSRAPLYWGLGLFVLVAPAVTLVLVLTAGGEETAATTTLPATTTGAVTTTAPTTQATTTTYATTTTQGTTTTQVATTTTRAAFLYGERELAYFEEIAGQAEYGDSGGYIHKWTGDLRLAVLGEPTARDRTVLSNVVDDLNDLLVPIEVAVVESDPDIEIYFVPEAEFAGVLPEYVPVNLGFFYVWWDDSGAITEGVILISTTGLTAEERAHLIREELTQSLGLLNDSPLYDDSIFQVEWTTTNRYSPLDRALIEMLYRPELTPGMTMADALAALEEISRR